jgi:hypothetical protein
VPAFVLDLPRLLVHVVGTANAQMDLGVVAKLHHPIRTVGRTAAPALDRPVTLGIDSRDDRFGAHNLQCAPGGSAAEVT